MAMHHISARRILQTRNCGVLAWVLAHQMPSGVLAEQLDPLTGTPLSVSPLTWSHAALVRTVADYQRMRHALRGGPLGPV
jgi:glucoamylase